jgi:hypothetical protein
LSYLRHVLFVLTKQLDCLFPLSVSDLGKVEETHAAAAPYDPETVVLFAGYGVAD